MRIISWLEKHFSRYAIPNLMLYIIVVQVAVVVFQIAMRMGNQAGIQRDFLFSLIPAMVMEGEVWRVFTFLFDEPIPSLGLRGMLSALFLVFYWMILQMMASSLEQIWGVFRLNLFVLTGYLLTLVSTFLAYLIDPNVIASNFFLYTSLFLAFARYFPDMVFRIYLLIPVKVRWIAYFYWAMLTFAIVFGGWGGLAMAVPVVLNYFLFFWRDHVQGVRQTVRRKRFEAKTGPAKRLVHVCHTCGLTSQDAPRTSFRYCSQCAGQLCYCPDHLRNHEHVVER